MSWGKLTPTAILGIFGVLVGIVGRNDGSEKERGNLEASYALLAGLRENKSH